MSFAIANVPVNQTAAVEAEQFCEILGPISPSVWWFIQMQHAITFDVSQACFCDATFTLLNDRNCVYAL